MIESGVNYMKEKQKPISWGIVIICFIFFWPAGIVLLIMRLSQQGNSDVFKNLNESIKKINPPTFFKSYPPLSVKCDSCGANNIVKHDEVTKCAYCGTPQNYPNK